MLSVKEADAKTTVHFEEKLKRIQEIRTVYIKVLEENACFSLKDLAISGSDLISLGIPAGKVLGEILKKVLDAVIDGEISNRKETLLSYVEKEYKKIP